MLKKAMSLLVCAVMMLGLTIVPVHANDGALTGSQKAYIVGDDWGPAVTKTVITLDKSISADTLRKEDFSVVEEKNVTNWNTMQEEIGTTDRQVLDVYPCDANGNKVDGDSNIIAIEMYVDPNTGSPFIYRPGSGFNYWCETYKLHVTLTDNSALRLTDGTKAISLFVEETIDLKGDDKIVPQVDGIFDIDQKYTANDGTVYNYADYTPAADNKTNALIIWLHGAGEGTDKGVNDSYIDLLGNEVTALVSDEFQDLYDGAYVLVPQAPTMWMDDGTGAYQNGDKGSCYKDSLFEMIQKYVADHPDIDPNRIIIGGCSNGGYMTMEMILAHPDYFAAAFPICEAFQDQYISDGKINAIANMPIWFTYAKNDDTVDPTICSEPTVERLLKAGAKDVHVSAFDDVHDTTGRFTDKDGVSPYQYGGHWSWIYFDNNECVDGDLNAWQWLAGQTATNNTIVAGNQKAYIIGDDWGPAVTKTIITLNKVIDTDSLNKDDFTVVEEKNATIDWDTGEEGIVKNERQVLDVYPCDANGNKVAGDSNIIAIEMYVDPNTGSPFIYRLGSGFNYWCETYNLYVTLADDSDLTLANGAMATEFNITAKIDLKGDDKIVPQVDGIFDIDQEYTANDGTVYNFADYTPAKDDKKNALVIWLHGAGEGTDEGVNDSYIDLLGNEVTAFVSDEFQELFEGAYVLVPQAPTMWMDDGTGEYQNGDKGSCYKDSLFEMIQKYVADHPDIDPNRIIIGGCSNGGYMTMEMILAHPDYFAAAFPICEAFYDEYITDEQIESLVDLPIWFTYAKNDDTVDPKKCAIPTIERLLKAGAKNVHVSVFEDVHDTTGRFVDEDGNPHQYSGHWSWIYFDNNECYEGELNAWQWLSKQVKSTATAVEPGVDTTKPGTTTSVKTGDDVALMGLGILMVLSAGTYTVARKRFH